MNFTQRTRGIVRAIAVVLSLAVPTVMADLGGRRPRRRRLWLGLPRLADLFRATVYLHRAGHGATVQPHLQPTG